MGLFKALGKGILRIGNNVATNSERKNNPQKAYKITGKQLKNKSRHVSPQEASNMYKANLARINKKTEQKDEIRKKFIDEL